MTILDKSIRWDEDYLIAVRVLNVSNHIAPSLLWDLGSVTATTVRSYLDLYLGDATPCEISLGQDVSFSITVRNRLAEESVTGTLEVKVTGVDREGVVFQERRELRISNRGTANILADAFSPIAYERQYVSGPLSGSGMTLAVAWLSNPIFFDYEKEILQRQEDQKHENADSA